jgi:hypothetical protein
MILLGASNHTRPHGHFTLHSYYFSLAAKQPQSPHSVSHTLYSSPPLESPSMQPEGNPRPQLFKHLNHEALRSG